MLFQTWEFLVLMAVVIGGILVIHNPRRQQIMLLLASYVFYGWWDVRFLMLILLSSIIDHTVALGISGVRLRTRQRGLYSAIVAGGSWLFLGFNWTMLRGSSEEFSVAAFLTPSWQGAWTSIAVVLGLVLMGNVLYGFLFRLSENGRRRAFLAISIISNLGMLGFFKYHNFFMENLVGLGGLGGAEWQPQFLDVALPVGISFYTFQTMSYTIDVYRSLIKPERSFLRTALYVAYFPQLVAGPILRPSQFLPTLNRRWTLEPSNVQRGFHLALVGLFKKVIIADWVGQLADIILNEPAGQSSTVIMLGSAAFAVQIYCDFSGYTDIARGISRMFGIEIPLNFNYPYFSTSIIEFWRRWHISLSTWLRDYLYIPLGGSRSAIPRVYANLMITMILGGLWHGAAWNFVIWGAYQGVLLCLNRFIRGRIEASAALSRLFKRRTMIILCWAVTLYFTLLGWLIFRVTGLNDLLYAVKKFVFFDGRLDLASVGLGRGSPIAALMAMLVFIVLHTTAVVRRPWDQTLNRQTSWRLPLAYAVLGFIFFLCWPSGNRPFIYFQF